MDMDTFMTTLYVYIDDWYQREMQTKLKRRFGPAAQMSDSEVLTVALAGSWRKGVPWQSERGLVRYMLSQGLGWFPQMLKRSRFNERVRNLWSVLVQLQQELAEELSASEVTHEVVDCLPLPSCSNSQSLNGGHWLWWGTRGHGGTQGKWYWGDQLIMSVTPQHIITGWLVGAANLDDRVLLQALLSTRHQQYEFVTPEPWRPWRRLHEPTTIVPKIATGTTIRTTYYVADKGFNGYRWQQHWWQQYTINVLTEPPRNLLPMNWQLSWSKWFHGLRQVIETTFAILCDVFAVKVLKAHSRWGQLTRLAASFAAFNWGIYCNRSMGRPDLAHATLLC